MFTYTTKDGERYDLPESMGFQIVDTLDGLVPMKKIGRPKRNRKTQKARRKQARKARR